MLKNLEIISAGPNIYSHEPVDRVGRKEIWEGLVYLTKKKIFKRRKILIVKKIRHKIALSKRIKTIKRLSKKA